MGEYTFKKEERLCNKRLIRALFSRGSSFVLYPFRISFLNLREESPSGALAQVIISVPKKKFKKAVHRNLLKRRMREAYRMNKAAAVYGFLPSGKGVLLLSIHYIGKELLDSNTISRKMKLALERMKDEYMRIYMAENH